MRASTVPELVQPAFWRRILSATLGLLALCAAASCGDFNPSAASGSPADAQAADLTPNETAADLATASTPAAALGPTPLPVLMTPNQGPTSGMQVVTITGQSLGHVQTVLFGATPALQVDVQDDSALQVIVPPHPSGVVDVTLRVAVDPLAAPVPDGKIVKGYRYIGMVEVTAVSPKSGPAQGGTALTITGSGFDVHTQFVVGHRLGLLPSVLDEHTATVLTPAGESGTVAVAAANPDGSGQLENAFTYHAPPELDTVSPGVLAHKPAGGSQLVLHGHNLAGALQKVVLMGANGAVAADIVSTDGATLVAKLGPEAASGVYDVTVQQADGVATLPQAVALVDLPPQPDVTPWTLWTVTPAAQPVNQLQPVALGVAGHASAGDWQAAHVAFGALPAQVLGVAVDADGAGATLQVQPPVTPETNLPQTVDVTVQIAGHTLQKFQSFRYLPAALHIDSLAPQLLVPAGGTPLQLTWSPHPQGQPPPVGVRIGALQASQVAVVKGEPGTLTCVAPPGAPGPADVTLVLADGTQATAWHAVQYAGTDHAIFAVLPAVGAQAGGTWASVIGEGLDGLQAVLFNAGIATQLQVMDSGWATLFTPRGNPGPADVEAVWNPATRRILSNGFTYFDPKDGNGGTWGATIGASLNVTVVERSDSTTPIPAALVIAVAGGKQWQGFTDDRGQITFSGPGMTAPVDVHASKVGFTAGSLIALSAENATIRLSSTTPASGNGNGSGDQPVAPPNGTITGTVLDADKYTVLPPGSCSGAPVTAGNCLLCTSDAGCGAHATCELPALSDATTITDGGFCAATCVSLTDCPDGFTCTQFGAGSGARWGCRPRIGEPQVRCEPAAGGIYGDGGQQAGGIVDAAGHFSLSVTPGPTAVICRSGYIDATTGGFVALTLGLTRNLFANPGQTVTGVQVHVRVPLNRQIRVHMLALPMGPDTTGGQRSVLAAIDLGADGYLAMGQTTTTQKTDTIVLTGQPSDALFQGDGASLRYEFYGGVATAYGGPPMSMADAPGRAVVGLEHAAVWHPGAPEPVNAKTAPGALHAFAAAGDTRVGVGDDGHIASWTGGDFTVQASPTAKQLNAVWLADDDAATAGLNGWAGGEAGVLVRRSPLGWALWPQGLGKSVVALQGRKNNDVWALHDDGSLHHWTGEATGTWQAVLGPALAARALLPLANGALLVAGDNGALWLGQPIVNTNNFVWLQQTTGTTAAIRALLHAADGTTWLAGDRGYLAVFNGKVVTLLNSGTFKNLYGLYGDPSGVVQIVGQTGTWLRAQSPNQIADHSLADMPVDLRGVLPTFDGGLVAAGEPVVEMGPYLEMPYLATPAPNGTLGQTIAWTVAPGNIATLNLIRIADATYTTRWEIYLHGSVTQAQLPDFPSLGQFNPLPPGTLFLRHWRILAPQLDIDALNPKLINQAYWVSWAYNSTTVASPMGQAAAFNPQLTPPTAPGPQPSPK